MTVTRDDVAKLAGVSVATVSYVVNNGPRPVSDKTREKVLWAIEQLGYRPSAIARSLKTKRTLSVGVVISDVLNPILAAISKSAEDLLLQQGYSLAVCNSDESPERELVWLRQLLQRRVDGIVLLPTGGNRSLLFSAMHSGQPFVLIDRQIDGLKADCVLFDNEQGAYQAVRHLIELGHSRIALLNLTLTLTPGRNRLRGYERALQEAGLQVYPELIREGSFKAEDSYAVAGELLELQPPPTAMLVSSNRLALGLLQQVKARGLRMPDDLALCAFDDVSYYTCITPSITAVSYDVQEFAEVMVQYLIDRIDKVYTGEPRTTMIPCHLEIRESTAGVMQR